MPHFHEFHGPCIQGAIKYLMMPVQFVLNALMSYMMNPQQLEQNDAHLQIATGRIPPAWSPEGDRRYPFRHWEQDVQLWVAATDIPEERIGAVVALRVLGSAKSLIREIPPDLLINGQDVPDPQNPQGLIHQTGLEVLLRTLARRYAPLEQEIQVNSISDLFTFKRHSGESTDDVLSRYELMLHRAQAQGGVVMNEPVKSWMLLTTLQIPKDKWFLLLSPFQGALPTTPQQYTQLCQYIRRQGHLYDTTQDPIKTLRQPTFFSGDGNDAQPVFTAAQWAVQDSISAEDSTDYGDDDWDHMSEASSGHSNNEEPVDLSDVADQDPHQALETLYLAYRFHKRRFRRFANQTGGRGAKGRGKGRRRFFRSRKGSGKGKSGTFYNEDPEETAAIIQEAFFGKGAGKGRGRKNPVGPDGKIMKCTECGSEEHFRKYCPKKSHHASSSSGHSNKPTAGSGFLTMPTRVHGYFAEPRSDSDINVNRIIYADGTEEIFHVGETTFEPVSAERKESLIRNFIGFFVSTTMLVYTWFAPFFHSSVRRPKGEGLLIDSGAVWNLTGEYTFKRMTSHAEAHGQGASYEEIPEHKVDGVGSVPSTVEKRGKTMLCLSDGTTAEFTSNMVKESDLPALFGLAGMHKNRALLDVCGKKLMFLGEGGYTIKLSPGSRVYPLETVPSGHLLLPCTEWEKCKPHLKPLMLY